MSADTKRCRLCAYPRDEVRRYLASHDIRIAEMLTACIEQRHPDLCYYCVFAAYTLAVTANVDEIVADSLSRRLADAVAGLNLEIGYGRDL